MTAALWSAFFAATAADRLIDTGIHADGMQLTTILFLGCGGGFLICIALDGLLRRFSAASLAASAAFSMIAGSGAAILWSVIVRVILAPAVRACFETIGG